MKRINQRKLSLSKNTIRTLAGAQLGKAAGGLSGDRCDLSDLCGGSGSIGSASGADNCHWSTGVMC